MIRNTLLALVIINSFGCAAFTSKNEVVPRKTTMSNTEKTTITIGLPPVKDNTNVKK